MGIFIREETYEKAGKNPSPWNSKRAWWAEFKKKILILDMNSNDIEGSGGEECEGSEKNIIALTFPNVFCIPELSSIYFIEYLTS